MIYQILSRIISMTILSIIMTVLSRVYHFLGAQMGREAFLAKEAARYDRHFANQDPVIVELIGMLILFCVLFAAYEVIAFGILKCLELIGPNKPAYGNPHQDRM